MEERLTDLEIKITHQDQIIEDLNQLFIEQRAQMDQLQAEVKKLTDSTAASGIPGMVDASQEAPPPHY